MANKILSLENISVVFDGFKALTDVNINVMENTIHFLLVLMVQVRLLFWILFVAKLSLQMARLSIFRTVKKLH